MANREKYTKTVVIPDMGRLQPQAQEVEKVILGALMLESRAFVEIEGIITASDFYDRANELIFAAIERLQAKKRPVDMLTVVEELKASGELETVGGAFYISSLTASVASAANIEYHARIVKQKSLARKIISLTAEVQCHAFDETIDVADVMELLEMRMTEITTNLSSGESIEMSEAVNAAIEKAAKIQEEREAGRATAIPTGIAQLDKNLNGGWKAPDLIVLGARPSMGKTQLALHFAKSAAMAGNDVLFVSIEMTATQLVNRYLLEEERINPYNLSTGQMSADEWEALDQRAAEIWNMKLHIADAPNMRYLQNIKSEARRLKRKGKLKMIVIDYLGLVRTNLKFDKRYLEVGYITGELKSLAKELDVPIIVLSQLNRPEKNATPKEPQLESLRESGDIEQDADIVLFIHRPSYYDREAEDRNGVRWEGRGKLIIAKYREGCRDSHVIFCHDKRFKKIGGESDFTDNSYMSPIPPDRNFEPDRGENPF